jgi:hypothetical protein
MPGEPGEICLVDGYDRRAHIASDLSSGRTEDGWCGQVKDVGRELAQYLVDPTRGNCDRQVAVDRERHRRDPLDQGPTFARRTRAWSDDQSFVAAVLQKLKDAENGVGDAVALRQQEHRGNRHSHVIRL